MRQLLKLLKMVPAKVRIVGVVLFLAALIMALGLGLGLSRRIVVALVLGVVVLGALLWVIGALVELGDRRRSRAFENRLGAADEEVPVAREEAREALRELSGQWKAAVGQLRESGLSIYDLPWYLMIGEPASGKTTTLKESGLEFPVGTESLSGPGGTRNCDWWFTNEAVILDTAGRFTFQVDTAPDRVEWNAFLGFLRRHRRTCPINGVVLVIPATSLLEDSIDVQEEKAQNIRRKLLHLQKKLEIRFPVFVLITKADRVLGFSEFFSRLEPADRRRMFGWSSHGRGEKAWDEAELRAAFGDVVERIHRLRLRFLSEETHSAETDRFFVFPEELAELERPLATYLNVIFAASRFDEPFIFRGFYLTSGLQEGRPIAQACRELLQDQMGGSEAVIEDLESVFTKSRAYFIRDFYEKKLFPEQGLIARTRAALKRDRIHRWVLYGATIAFLAMAVPVLILAHLRLRHDLGNLVPAVCAAESCLAGGERPPACQRFSTERQRCDFSESYRRLAAVERARRDLMEAPRWMRWSLLRGKRSNEVTAELLPRIEAALLRQNILPVVLDSAARRTGESLWRRDRALPRFDDYELFLAAFREVLALRESGGTEGGADLSVRSIVAFLKAASGRDVDDGGELVDAGESVDGMLALPPEISDRERLDLGAVFDQTREYFRPAGDPVPVAGRSLAESFAGAFRAYWRIGNVGRWYQDLHAGVEGYNLAYEAIRGMEPASYATAAELLSDFSTQAALLAGHWQAGRTLMAPAGEAGALEELRQGAGEAVAAAAGEASPAPEWKKWESDCRSDWQELSRRSPDLLPDSKNPCGKLRPDWLELRRRIELYGHLYERQSSAVPYGRDAYRWARISDQLAEPLRGLGELAEPAACAEASSALRRTLPLDDSLGEQAHLREIEQFRQEQESLLLADAGPLAQLRAIEVGPELERVFGVAVVAKRAEAVAHTALALRVLEPTADFFAGRLNAAAAKPEAAVIGSYVTPANRQVEWLIDQTGYAVAFSDLRERIEVIHEAEFSYLDAWSRRARCGNLSGEIVVCPREAGNAGSWADFRFQIGAWEPIREVAGGAGGGVATAEEVLGELRILAQGNPAIAARVEPLVRELQSRCRAPAVSPALASAARSFRSCVDSLDPRPQEAGRQVAAGECGESRKLNFFSRLPPGSSVNCLRRVESRGAGLLANDSTPRVEPASGSAPGQEEKNRIDDFLRAGIPWGRYPFVPRGQLGSGIRDHPRQIVLPTVELSIFGSAMASFSALEQELDLDRIEPEAAQAGKLAALEAWRNLFAAGDPTATVTMLAWPPSARLVEFGPRGSQQSFLRQGSSAQLALTRAETYVVRVVGRYEADQPWETRLDLTGGPLKVLYFVQARGRQVDGEGRTWVVPVQLASPDRSRLRDDLRPSFEIRFRQPLPAAFPD